jgi:hypothetical protein
MEGETKDLYRVGRESREEVVTLSPISIDITFFIYYSLIKFLRGCSPH